MTPLPKRPPSWERCARSGIGGRARRRRLDLLVVRSYDPPVPEPIAVHLSMPDGRLLPVDALLAAHESVLRTEGRKALEYGGSQGFEGLRAWLAADYNSRESVPTEARSIVLTSGASGGLSDLCDAVLTPG